MYLLHLSDGRQAAGLVSSRRQQEMILVLGFLNGWRRSLPAAAIVGSIFAGFEVGNGQATVLQLLAAVVLVLLVSTLDAYVVVLVWLTAAPAFQWWDGISLGPLPDVTPHRLLLGVAFAICVFRHPGAVARALSYWRAEVVLALFYVLFSGVAIASRATEHREVLEWFQVVLLPFMAFLLPLILVRNLDQARRILSVSAVVVVYLFVPAVYEQITQTSFVPGLNLWRQGTGAPGFRSISLAGSASGLSNMGVFLVPGILYRLLSDRGSSLMRVGNYVLLVLAMGIVLLSSVRSGWMVATVMLGVTFALVRRARKLLLPLFVLVIALLLWSWADLMETEWFQMRGSNLASLADRSIMLQEQIARLWKDPLFGSGGDQALVTYSLNWTVSSHNTFMSIALHTGLVGLLLYVGPMVLLVLRTLLVWRTCSSENRPLGDGAAVSMMWLSVAGLLVNGMFMDLRYFGVSNALLWFYLGLLAQTLALRPNEGEMEGARDRRRRAEAGAVGRDLTSSFPKASGWADLNTP